MARRSFSLHRRGDGVCTYRTRPGSTASIQPDLLLYEQGHGGERLQAWRRHRAVWWWKRCCVHTIAGGPGLGKERRWILQGKRRANNVGSSTGGYACWWTAHRPIGSGAGRRRAHHSAGESSQSRQGDVRLHDCTRILDGGGAALECARPEVLTNWVLLVRRRWQRDQP